MKWEDVRKTYPNKFVKLQILEFHLEVNTKIIDEMAVINTIDDNKNTTKELTINQVKCWEYYIYMV